MVAIALLAFLLTAGPQDPSSTSAYPAPPPDVSAPAQPHWTPEQLAGIKDKEEKIRQQHEPERQEAIRMNAMAANLHSEADARKLVDAVAEQITHHQHLMWAASSIRHRVAHTEYEGVSDPSGLIPEQRIVDVWNEYVREIDAPEETLINVAEFHAFRQTQLWMTTHYQWKHDLMQSVWTMPNIYAVDADGQLADGCRALEALKLIQEMHERFANLLIARERLAKGLSIPSPANPDTASKSTSDSAAGKVQLASSWRPATASIHAGPLHQNPILPAAYRYQQEHGNHAYDQLVRRLFDELMPPQ